MPVLPLTAEETREYNNVPTTPMDAPLGDIINELNGVATLGNVAILWRPGGVAGGTVATTWAGVEALLAAQAPTIPVTIYVDTFFAPAVVPATANTELDGRVTFSPFRFVVGSNTIVTVADGGILRNVTTLSGTITIEGAPTAQPFIVIDRPGNLLQLREASAISLLAGATAPAIDVLATAPFFDLASNITGLILSAAGPLQGIVRLASGLFVILAGFDNIAPFNPLWPPQTIEGDALCTMFQLFDASAAPAVQTLFLGLAVPLPCDLAADCAPSAGTTLGRPPSPDLGEMFFDTTIGFPVWWTGALWVDATGAPA